MATTAVSVIGGSSISGVSVSCYSTMENCLEACYMSCYFADHCNDSPGEMVACAPGLSTSKMEDFSIQAAGDKVLKSGIDCLLQRMPLVQKLYDVIEEERCQDVNWTDAG